MPSLQVQMSWLKEIYMMPVGAMVRQFLTEYGTETDTQVLGDHIFHCGIWSDRYTFSPERMSFWQELAGELLCVVGYAYGRRTYLMPLSLLCLNTPSRLCTPTGRRR